MYVKLDASDTNISGVFDTHITFHIIGICSLKICLPHCINVSHSNSVIVNIYTPYYWTYVPNNNCNIFFISYCHISIRNLYVYQIAHTSYIYANCLTCKYRDGFA